MIIVNYCILMIFPFPALSGDLVGIIIAIIFGARSPLKAGNRLNPLQNRSYPLPTTDTLGGEGVFFFLFGEELSGFTGNACA